MTTLTIEIPDAEIDEVVKNLKEKQVRIKEKNLKSLDDLTIEDYRKTLLSGLKTGVARRLSIYDNEFLLIRMQHHRTCNHRLRHFNPIDHHIFKG